MGRGARAGLMAGAALASMTLMPAIASAENGHSPTATVSPFDEIPEKELLTCIAQELPSGTDLVNFSRVCQQWQATAQKSLEHSIQKVRTQLDLNAALINPNSNTIVVTPDDDLEITTLPVNPQVRIFVHDTAPKETRKAVSIYNDVQVTASGTAYLITYNTSHVQAFGHTLIEACAKSHVTASKHSTVLAMVIEGGHIIGKGPSVQIFASDSTRPRVEVDDVHTIIRVTYQG